MALVYAAAANDLGIFVTKHRSNSPITTLDRPVRDFLASVGELAAAEKTRAYLVGGGVRDVMLGKSLVDVDIAVVGNAHEFMRELVICWKNRFPQLPTPQSPILFPRYRTGKLVFSTPVLPGVQMLDFSSTRDERYPTPGQSPEIQPGDLQCDLARRDFSVNAIAVSLLPEDFLSIIDPEGGQRDLELRQLRILHRKSFIDDPARLIRAVRFQVRLGFRLEAETERRFREACEGRVLCSLPFGRCVDEFRKALTETKVGEVCAVLASSGLLACVDSALCLAANDEEKFAKASARFALEFPPGLLVDEKWAVPLTALLVVCKNANAEKIVSELRIRSAERESLLAVIAQGRKSYLYAD